MRIYLDTSVFSAILDTRDPSRQALSKAFWRARDRFECVTSDVCRREIMDTPDPLRRKEMLELFVAVAHVEIDSRSDRLSREYIARQVFTPSMEDDSMHVACATVEGCSAILSWNFKHLVNQRRRLLVNVVNDVMGYPAIDILTPAEV